MKHLVELNICDVILYPEIYYGSLQNIHENITAIESAKHADKVMLWFMVMV